MTPEEILRQSECIDCKRVNGSVEDPSHVLVCVGCFEERFRAAEQEAETRGYARGHRDGSAWMREEAEARGFRRGLDEALAATAEKDGTPDGTLS